MASFVGDERRRRAACRFGGAGGVARDHLHAQSGTDVGVRDGVAGAFGRFDRAAVGPGLIAAQPLVAEARGGARPFAGAGAQRLAELGTA